MNICQLQTSEQFTNASLYPLYLNQTKKNLFGISVLYPQTVMIRAITPEQCRQIVDNPLTERELCVLKMIVDGKSNLAIAQELGLKVGTIKTHTRHILSKLNVPDRTQAAVTALRSGLVD